MRINIWNAHAPEAELAIYGSGPESVWQSPWIWFHVSRCERCSMRAREYAEDRKYLRHAAELLPTGVNWERLSSEMTANIRVGLAAGECVTPHPARRAPGFRSFGDSWRVAAACAGFAVLMAAAWWLNTPAPRTESLSRAVKAIASRTFMGGDPGGGGLGGGLLRWDEARSMVHASAQGIELVENGSSLGISATGVSQSDARPVAVTLSVQGSARAHYVDADTGQITITSVYAQ